MGIDDALGQFIGKIFSSDSMPAGGASPMGDFDPEQFVNANLSRAMHSKDTQVGSVIRGGMNLLGIGPSRDTSADVRTESAKPTGNLDYLGGLIDSFRMGQGQ